MYSDRRFRGLSRFFFIGSLAVDLNAIGTAQSDALVVPIGIASTPLF